MEQIEPKYEFAKYEEGVEVPAQPIKRNIAKTMEVTEMFTVYDAMVYLSKVDKAIADKQAEIDGLVAMKEAYEKELKVVEKALDVQKSEDEYQKELAESFATPVDAEAVEVVE